jgi:predicted component of type VI protein secretion system
VPYISSGLVSNTDKYSKIILNKLTTNPAFVTKRLLKYGVTETAIQSFKNGITKESIKKIIDETIEEYEQEENK